MATYNQLNINNNTSIIYGQSSIIEKTKNMGNSNKLMKTKAKPVFAVSSHTNPSSNNVNSNYDVKIQNKNILN